MKDPASTVFDNEETVQDSKGESGHREEVHGRAVIAQESSPEFPCLLRRRQALDIARNCPFRDLEAEVERFTMNSGSAPGGILFHHPLDEKSNLGIDLLAGQGSLGASASARTTESQPDARRQRFLV
jgi:hypothetical protein